MLLFNGFRTFFYILLWLDAVVLLGLCAHRLYYTTHLHKGDPLNNGEDFYDPVVAELLTASILTILWIPYILRTIHHRHHHSVFHTFLHSLIGLLLLSILFLSGAGVSHRYWSDLDWCWDYRPCRILTVLLAVSWVAAALSVILLLIELAWVIKNKAWKQPMHGYYEEERRGWFRR